MRFAKLGQATCQELSKTYKLSHNESKLSTNSQDCLLTSIPLFEDNLPINLAIQVNGRAIQLPSLIPSNRVSLEGRRHARPINITQAVCL